jgi:hypothetical protein
MEFWDYSNSPSRINTQSKIIVFAHNKKSAPKYLICNKTNAKLDYKLDHMRHTYV